MKSREKTRRPQPGEPLSGVGKQPPGAMAYDRELGAMALVINRLQILVVMAIVGEVLAVLFPSSIDVAGLSDVTPWAKFDGEILLLGDLRKRLGSNR